MRNAEVTVAAIPVPLKEASSFGLIDADPDGRVRGFQEKPKHPAPIPSDPGKAYASMGNYLFNTRTLIEALEEANRKKETDFGRHVLPRLVGAKRLFAYDFSTNIVPGLKSYEDRTYWRDVGTIEAYYEAHQDVLGLGPRFDVFNPKWPIYSSNYQGPVARIVDGKIESSIIGAGTIINGAAIRNSIVRREVIMEEEVEVDRCIIMDNVHLKRGAKLKRTIVDQHNVIEAGKRIGYDLEEDRKEYHVSETGIVVVPKGLTTLAARYTFGEYH
jgi:glucose-1-phosphate adenylyltransferase